MNLLDNLESEECIICYEEIRADQIYAMIDQEGESAKYHVNCIEKWLNKSKNGILIQKPIEKLNLYFGNDKVCHMNLLVPEKVINYDQLDECCYEICIIF
jgi:hypothetical protein